MDKTLQEIKKAIFTGLSYMIPLVAGSGLMLALGSVLSIAMGFDPSGSEFAWSIDGTDVEQLSTARFDQVIWWTGKFGLTIMPAFLAGFIANAITGKPGIAPGFVLGTMAGIMNGSFIGGIVAGLMAGYIANFIKKNIKLPPQFSVLLSFSIIPLFTMLIGGLIYRYSIGLGIKEIMDLMYAGLNSLNANPESRIILAIILGAMVCFDFGGPVNKTAILFIYGVYAETRLPSTYAHLALSVPNVAIFATYLVNKQFFSEAGKTNATTNFVLGMFGIGENSIPFAMAKPTIIMPAMVSGGAVAGGLAAYFNLDLLPTLSFFMALPFIPITNGAMGLVWWSLAFFAGVAVAVVIMSILLRMHFKGKEDKIAFFSDKEAGFSI